MTQTGLQHMFSNFNKLCNEIINCMIIPIIGTFTSNPLTSMIFPHTQIMGSTLHGAELVKSFSLRDSSLYFYCHYCNCILKTWSKIKTPHEGIRKYVVLSVICVSVNYSGAACLSETPEEAL